MTWRRARRRAKDLILARNAYYVGLFHPTDTVAWVARAFGHYADTRLPEADFGIRVVEPMRRRRARETADLW